MQNSRRAMIAMLIPLASLIALGACQSSDSPTSFDQVKQGLVLARQGMDDANLAMQTGDQESLGSAVHMMDQAMAMMQQGMMQMGGSSGNGMMGGSSGNGMMGGSGMCGGNNGDMGSSDPQMETMGSGMHMMMSGLQMMRSASSMWQQEPAAAYDMGRRALSQMRAGMGMMQRGMMGDSSVQGASCGCQQPMDCAIAGSNAASSCSGGPSSCGCSGSGGGSCR